jgi:hypothetical protein
VFVNHDNVILHADGAARGMAAITRHYSLSSIDNVCMLGSPLILLTQPRCPSAPSLSIDPHTCTTAWHPIQAASTRDLVIIFRVGQKRPDFPCIRDKVISATDG